MSELKTYIAAPTTAPSPQIGEVQEFVARYEWFAPARTLLEMRSGVEDRRLAVVAPWRGRSALRLDVVDAKALLAHSSDELIDRFLREKDLRIVAGEGEPEAEVRTEAELDDDDLVVSEQLAEIYLAQGLRDRAVTIYRKLSLRNPEKSVYFAELIGKIENNN